MLSTDQFTVGSIGEAKPLSLVLPRASHEETILIATCSSVPAAFFLLGNHQFHWFECTNNTRWSGLMIGNVRIEVDETSVFDPGHVQTKLGTVVRNGSQLLAEGMTERQNEFRRRESVVLEDGLPQISQSAAFTRWQIVLGSGQTKRVLHGVSIE